MKYTTHNSMLQVRRLEQLKVSCTGRRAWSPNFQ
jgi:hypothetical protein